MLPTTAHKGSANEMAGEVVKETTVVSAMIGASFCHTLIIRQFIHEVPIIVCGSQKWKGGRPNFRKRPQESNKISNLIGLLIRGEKSCAALIRISEDPIA